MTDKIWNLPLVFVTIPGPEGDGDDIYAPIFLSSYKNEPNKSLNNKDLIEWLNEIYKTLAADPTNVAIQ
jgi:hypothetical protein